jgi:dihydroxy-acid dehydratase
METTDVRHRSRTILQGRDRAPARSFLKGMGYSDEDLSKPIVGVAHSWIETMPCNYNHRHLAEKVKDGIREAGGTPMELNTIAISDGITMGTQGMKASLVSRELIADSIELVGRGHMFDAMVTIVGCDKTIPAAAMAHARLGIPGAIVYSGSIAPGRFKGHDVTIQDVFEGVGANAAGKMSDEDLLDLEEHACPGAGACGGQYTANTMAMVLEFLGLSPMGSAAPPALDGRKDAEN